MFRDERRPLPPELGQLRDQILTPRDNTKITPKSKRLANRTVSLQKINKFRMIAKIENLLFYRQKLFEEDTEGEENIKTARDEQWINCVPQPPNHKNAANLEDAFAVLGLPPKPKLDSMHGFADEAFEGEPALHRAKNCVNSDSIVHRKAP